MTLFIGSWLLCGGLSWLAFSVASRGKAGLGFLPLSMAAGVAGGLSVPLLLRDDAFGIPLSLMAACAVPAVLLGARRYSLGAKRERSHLPPVPQENLE